MGLELGNVVSDERHYGDFVCVICQNLIDLDAIATTSCSHAFCRSCLQEWVGRSSYNTVDGYLCDEGPRAPKCPTCSNDLLYSSKYPSMMIKNQTVNCQLLSACQPLAYRVLRRIEVRCPLNKVGCKWSGDYGDLKDHLFSRTAHEDCDESEPMEVQESENPAGPMEVESEDRKGGANSSLPVRERRRALAESFKEEGNEQFLSGHYNEAKELYSKAISIMSSEDSADEKLLAALHSNRAACFLSLEAYSDCVNDCNKALEFDPTYIKAYVRKAKALIQLGHFQPVIELWEEAQQKCGEHSQKFFDKELLKAQSLRQLMQEGQDQLKQGAYGAAKATFGKLLADTSAGDVLVGAAKANLGLGLVEPAMRFSMQIIRGFPDHVAEGYEVRGHCLFLMGDFEGGQKLIIEALRQAPDLASAQILRKKCNKVLSLVKEARGKLFHREFEDATEFFNAAIEECHTLPARSTLYGILHTERAETMVRLKRYDKALQDCANVLYARDDFKPAWLVKLQALHGLGRHEAAKTEAEDLMRKYGPNDEEIHHAYNKADFEVRKMKRPDYYNLLGVSRIASELEIKRAFQQKSREVHPDAFAGDNFSDEQRKAAVERYRLLGDALEILCDDFQRKLYDYGYDKEAIKQKVEAAQRAARMQA